MPANIESSPRLRGPVPAAAASLDGIGAGDGSIFRVGQPVLPSMASVADAWTARSAARTAAPWNRSTFAARSMLAGAILFSVIALAMLLAINHLLDRQVRENYLRQADSIVAAIDLSLTRVGDLQNQELLQYEIERLMAGHPDLDGLTIYGLRGPVLQSLASSHDEVVGLRAGHDPSDAFYRDTALVSVMAGEGAELLRVYSPLRAAGKSIGTVQVDLALESKTRLLRQVSHASLLVGLTLAVFLGSTLAWFVRRRSSVPLAMNATAAESA